MLYLCIETGIQALEFTWNFEKEQLISQAFLWHLRVFYYNNELPLHQPVATMAKLVWMAEWD